MTTLTQTFETFAVCRDDESETWDVVDAAGEVLDSFESKAEAVAEAARMSREAEVEHLADAIAEAIERAREYGDLEGLRRMADFVGGIR